MDDLAEITAVLTNYNGGQRILAAIKALYRQPTPLAAIIVVDNASSDGSPAQIAAQFPDVCLLTLPDNLGPTVARNHGLRAAHTPLVLLLDDDVYVADDCLAQLYAVQRQQQATVVLPRIQFASEPPLIQCDGAAHHFVGTMILRHGQQRPETVAAATTPVRGFISSCLLVDRAAMLAAGGFNEAFFIYFDDLELSNRLFLLGQRFVCVETAVAYHDPASRPGIAFRQANHYPVRRAYMTMRHRLAILFLQYRWRSLLVLAPALLLYEAATLGLALGRGWGWAWLRAWLWLFKMLPTRWPQRQQLQRGRVVGDQAWLVGGTLPLNPQTLQSKPSRWLVVALSAALNGYWRLVRPLLGSA